MDAGLSVEELAERSGVAVRTIRYYQTEGVLPPPERIGRAARYGEAHVNRLLMIGALQLRGLKLHAIGSLLSQVQAGRPGWFGLEQSLSRPWTEDRPVLLTEPELVQRAGPLGAAAFVVLEAAGLVERRADTTPVTYLVPSPALLDIGVDMRALGIDVETSLATKHLLQANLGALADELVATITERVSIDRLQQAGPEALATLVDRLRPLAQRSVEVVFAHEMERALRIVLEPKETAHAAHAQQ